MRYLVKFVVIFFIALSGCKDKQPKKMITDHSEINRVNPIEFQQKLKSNTIIDIRTPAEFKSGYIEGAININMFDKDFITKMKEFNKNEPIFIYCRSGNRTSSVSNKLAKMGFKKIYDLNGGILNWRRNNLKIVK